MIRVLTQVDILRLKFEIFPPLSLGKRVSEKAVEYLRSARAAAAAAVDCFSLHLDLLQNFDLAAKC